MSSALSRPAPPAPWCGLTRRSARSRLGLRSTAARARRGGTRHGGRCGRDGRASVPRGRTGHRDGQFKALDLKLHIAPFGSLEAARRALSAVGWMRAPLDRTPIIARPHRRHTGERHRPGPRGAAVRTPGRTPPASPPVCRHPSHGRARRPSPGRRRSPRTCRARRSPARRLVGALAHLTGLGPAAASGGRARGRERLGGTRARGPPVGQGPRHQRRPRRGGAPARQTSPATRQPPRAGLRGRDSAVAGPD